MAPSAAVPLLSLAVLLHAIHFSTSAAVSAVGDPGMLNPSVSVAYTGWSFCNAALAPPQYNQSVSPRLADCVRSDGSGPGPYGNAVTDVDNQLGPGQPFPGNAFPTTSDVNLYAREKELYLGSVCQQVAPSGSFNYSHWSVMFKSGNMNTAVGVCPKTNFTPMVDSAVSVPAALKFDNLPMNQPYVVHGWSTPGRQVPYGGVGTVGYFAGSFDFNNPNETVDAALHEYTTALFEYRIGELNGTVAPKPALPAVLAHASYLSTLWYKNVTSGSTVFYVALLTNPTYPWLMNYLRSNDMGGNGYGGYPWPGAGIMNGPVPSYATNMTVKLTVLDPGAKANNFYMPEISGCWQMDGSPCTGDLNLDVTRYICFITNPAIGNDCSAKSQGACPPVHYLSDGTPVYRNNTEKFPYECYSGYCAPGSCDPYSNPNTQELMQILPCSEWAVHGFPSKKGQGWIGDDQVWNLNVGALAARLYLAGAEPADIPDRAAKGWAPLPPLSTLPPYPGWTRSWISFEVGPEQFDATSTLARWEVTQWDVLVESA